MSWAWLGVGLLVVGCGGASGAVRDAASYELGCPSDQIQVAELGGGEYAAFGCGKKARYSTDPEHACSTGRCPLRKPH